MYLPFRCLHRSEAPERVPNCEGAIRDPQRLRDHSRSRTAHIHRPLETPKNVYGDHLEKGCRVLYLAEFTALALLVCPLPQEVKPERYPPLTTQIIESSLRTAHIPACNDEHLSSCVASGHRCNRCCHPAPDVHVWQKQELTFTSERSFKNAYMGRTGLGGAETF